jgi:nifR3 family TIM-barrel protein
MFYKDIKTGKLTNLDEKELPASVQIFGSDPGIMAAAAEMLNSSNASAIDINMGCPTPKITSNGDGSALLRNPQLASAIIKAVVNVSKKPVTVKIRSGWDKDSINAVEIAKIAQENGAVAITVHGRTREQFFRGIADLDIIKQVKGSVSIPVIGNGDIFSSQDAQRMFEETGCDAVMVGRGALGNPWIFRQIDGYLKTGEILPEPSVSERIDMAKRHLNMEVEYRGEYTGIREMRKHIAWYIRGMKNAARIRDAVFRMETSDEIIDLLDKVE